MAPERMVGHRSGEDRLVAVGRVARPQGRYGEVAVEPWTDFPERFAGLRTVFVEDARGEPRSVRLLGARLHKGRPVLRLSGVSSIEEAEALRGKELRIAEADLVPLPEGSYYHFEIEGLSVEDRTRGPVGVVRHVLPTGGTDVLVVTGSDGAEILIPLCQEIVRNIDILRGCILIDAPEGLVSLNAN